MISDFWSHVLAVSRTEWKGTTRRTAGKDRSRIVPGMGLRSLRSGGFPPLRSRIAALKGFQQFGHPAAEGLKGHLGGQARPQAD